MLLDMVEVDYYSKAQLLSVCMWCLKSKMRKEKKR